MTKRDVIYRQVGITAMRDVDGSFLPSRPLFVQVSAEDLHEGTDIHIDEEPALKEVSGIFTEMFQKYVAAGGLRNNK